MKLYFVNGPEAGQIREGKERLRLGRETDNDISILSGGLSRYHALIEKKENGWLITDLNSTNGTKVNGKTISVQTPVQLHDGDLCTLGDQVFRVEIEPPELNGSTESARVLEMPVPPESPFPRPSSPVEEPLIRFNLSTEEPVKPEILPPAAVPPPPVSSEPMKASDLSGRNLFGGNNRAESDDEAQAGENGKSSRLGNIVFVALSALAVLILILIVLLALGGGVENQSHGIVRSSYPVLPPTVMFDRQRAENGNVFRFNFRMEQGRFVRVKIVDVLSGINYDTHTIALFPEDPKMRDMPPWPERKKALEQFQDALRASGLMALNYPAQTPVSDASDYYRLAVCFEETLVKVDEFSNQPPASVFVLERAIEQFCGAVLKLSITKPPQEALAEAEQSFTLGKELYDNREANPENLKKAIRYFKIVQTTLTLFHPKPEIFTRSQEISEICDKLKSTMVNKLKSDANISVGLQNFPAALRNQQLMLRYFDEEHDAEEVKKCRDNIAKLQSIISGQQ